MRTITTIGQVTTNTLPSQEILRLPFSPPYHLIQGHQRHQEQTVRPLNLTHRPQIRPTQTHLKKTALLQRWGQQILYLIVKTFIVKTFTIYIFSKGYTHIVCAIQLRKLLIFFVYFCRVMWSVWIKYQSATNMMCC